MRADTPRLDGAMDGEVRVTQPVPQRLARDAQDLGRLPLIVARVLEHHGEKQAINPAIGLLAFKPFVGVADARQVYPDPGGARNPFAAWAKQTATTRPMPSIIRLRNRRPLRNPWATPSSVAKAAEDSARFLLEPGAA